MANPIDMSLDDLIHKERSGGGGGRGGSSRGGGRGGRGGSRGRGGDRRRGDGDSRGPERIKRRRDRTSEPYKRSEFPVRSGDSTKKWTHDLYDTPEVHEGGKSYKGARGKRSDEIALGACVYLKNLNYEVDEDDLKGLFRRYGEITSAVIDYDKSGRSEGTATVAFKRLADCETAVEALNGKLLKGDRLQLSLTAPSDSSGRGGEGNDDDDNEMNGGGRGGSSRAPSAAGRLFHSAIRRPGDSQQINPPASSSHSRRAAGGSRGGRDEDGDEEFGEPSSSGSRRGGLVIHTTF